MHVFLLRYQIGIQRRDDDERAPFCVITHIHLCVAGINHVYPCPNRASKQLA